MNRNVSLKEAVYALVKKVPEGRVITYGDIAILVGHPYAARLVGGIAHFGPTELPWHRVVNRFGDCASGYPGGKTAHQDMLRSEGIEVDKYRIVEFEKLRWHP